VNIVSNDLLDLDAFRAWRPDYRDAEFILEDGKYVCGWAVEKMSKSMFNVVNPDDIVERYGADTLRLYEMFLGPIEQSKPWDTNGIDGVNRFLKKMWNLFYKGDQLLVDDATPSADALKSVHKLIKKVTGDIENFSYNTSVSAFMICVNELTALKCHNRELLANFIVLLAPFAPHVSEELWHALGNNTSVCDATWPKWNEDYLKESSANYAISFNGKQRFNLSVPADMPSDQLQQLVLNHEQSAKWLEGKTVRKIIVVPGKIVNVVVA
jgi:leucyl-tRNA synthetase